ncbi:MAG TPA: flagellar basal body-associated FliL family protein [Clostridia bacterium]|nr:flagellar basal body-associated FliL family protein [Clostridia bacterium]
MSDNEKRKGPLLIVIILLLVLTILLVAVGAAYYFLVVYDGSSAYKSPNKMTLDTFTVNLADNNFRRYIRLTMTLEFEDGKLANELEDKMHRINDTIISHLTTKRATDMTDKEVVRKDLEKGINSVLTTGQINGVYFEEFIIQ